ncbi:MAG: DUF3108 domain-containing protein [Geminicoccaceae bacterium]
MSITRRFLALTLLSCLTCLSSVSMAGSSKQVDVRMIMYLAGFTAGTVDLSVKLNDVDAVSSMQTKSTGFIKMLTGYKGKSEAHSALIEGGWPKPISYGSDYFIRKSEKKFQIKYSPSGDDITDLRLFERGEPRDSKVPENMRPATIDPLTAILQLRRWVLAMRNDPATARTHRFEIFDGGRRYQLNAQVLDRLRARFGGKSIPAFRIKVKMKPMAGFNKNDMLTTWSDGNDDRWIELYVTDDDNPVPLSIQSKGSGFKTTLVLKQVCTNGGSCRKFKS